MKKDHWYKRIVRRGIHSVKLEVLLVAIGHNLYKYQKKRWETELPHRFKKKFLWGRGSALFCVWFHSSIHNKCKKGDVKKLNRVFSHPLLNFTEAKRFELSCHEKVTTWFRVRLVMTASIHLQSILYIKIRIKSTLINIKNFTIIIYNIEETHIVMKISLLEKYN